MTQRTADLFSPFWMICIGLSALCLLVFGFGSWAATARIAGAIVAPGQVSAQQPVLVVQHPKGGQIKDLSVQEGTPVRAGDLLLRFDSTALVQERDRIAMQIMRGLAEYRRLLAERDGTDQLHIEAEQNFDGEAFRLSTAMRAQQENLFAARQNTFDTELSQLHRRKEQLSVQEAGLAAQLASLKQRAMLLDQDLDRQEHLLARGLVQARSLSALRQERTAFQGDIGEFTAALAQLKGRAIEIDLEMSRAQAARREAAMAEIGALEPKLLERMSQFRSVQENIRNRELRAPIAGVIHDLRFESVNTVVRAAEPILRIIPENQVLMAELRMPPAARDKIWIGQGAELRLDGADQDQAVAGQVTQISADVFRSSEGSDAFFSVEISVTATDPNTSEIWRGAQVGRPLTAYVKTEERRVLGYLLAPLRAYAVKAFRES